MPANNKNGMPANLKPVQTKEEAKSRGRNGGIKSGEVRRQKKNMKELAKQLLYTNVPENMEGVRKTLHSMGLEDDEMTFAAAVTSRLIHKAVVEGEIVGGAVVNINEETQHNHLDFIYVKYGTQSKGIGKKIWEEIELMYPKTKVWEIPPIKRSAQ